MLYTTTNPQPEPSSARHGGRARPLCGPLGLRLPHQRTRFLPQALSMICLRVRTCCSSPPGWITPHAKPSWALWVDHTAKARHAGDCAHDGPWRRPAGEGRGDLGYRGRAETRVSWISKPPSRGGIY